MKIKNKILFTVLFFLSFQTNSFSKNLNTNMDKTKTIVFIHGLWMHASSWQQWMDFFNNQGYKTINPGWPGDSLTVAECRANSQSIANRGVEEIVESYAKIIRNLPEPPIVIGHSFGGLIAQILLSRGLASACIAIDPAPLKGVWQLPFTAIKAAFPVIGNPFNLSKAKSLTYEQFRYGFANAVSEKEAKELYELWTIPAPCRPLFQAATASFSGIQTKVNTQNTTRGPLLITGGEKDNQAPAIIGKASVKKYNKKVITDFKLFEERGHSLIVDSGWKEIAEYSLNWLRKQGL
jgi:non-heme chloroperoxidase